MQFTIPSLLEECGKTEPQALAAGAMNFVRGETLARMIHKVFIDQPQGASAMPLTLVAVRREPSGVVRENS